MAWQLDETASPPRPVLARRLAAQIGRNFSETISALIRLDDDVEAVVRHFHDEHAEEAKKAACCQRGRAEPPASETPKLEPIFICKSESEPIVVYTPCPPTPNNAAFIAEAVACGLLAPALLWTGRTVYASPGLARYLAGALV